MKEDASDIIDLDIGGTHKITTTRATLTKYKNSVLSAQFNGKHQHAYNKGRIFIDWDGRAFASLISFLRTGKIPVFDNVVDEQKFRDELHYF